MTRTADQRVVLYTEDDPLVLLSGARLGPVEVAYDTYGELSAARDNVVFICHALTGDSHAAEWWGSLVGPGKPVDTDRFFVVCPNLLGGCQGTTGPLSTDPATGEPYGLDFPLLHMSDFVTVHRALLAHLGVQRPYAVVGGSLGGMQVLQWTLDAPGEVERAVLVAASSRLTAQNIAFSAVAREAIMRDPDFQDGRYPGTGRSPDLGLAIARMMAHITYLSGEAMDSKFGRRLQATGEEVAPYGSRMGLGVDFQVESYLNHQGETFLDRFDALSYLYLSRVMDYYDAFGVEGVDERIRRGGTSYLVLSFDSDWRFDTSQSRRIVRTLTDAGAAVSFRELRSPWGHDSFLLDVPGYQEAVDAFLSPDPETPTDGRGDLDVVADLVPPGSRVLDLGCGDGALLAELAGQGCTGHGVEIEPSAVLATIRRGVPVDAVDIAELLPTLPDRAYDVVVVSQTLQAMWRPDEVLRQVARVGRSCVVSVPNFGLWRHRLSLLATGRMPVSRELPHHWYETPNIHLSTLADIEALFDEIGLAVARRVLLAPSHKRMRGERAANLRAGSAIYLLTPEESAGHR